MHKNYNQFSIEELIQDESFRKWIIEKDSEESVFWENWQKNNPNAKKNIGVAMAFLLNLQEKETHISEKEIEHYIGQVINQTPTKNIVFWKNTYFRIAASIIFLGGLSLAVYNMSFKNSFEEELGSVKSLEKYVENKNATENVQIIKLSDGSEVSLFPKSTIKYPNPFEDKKREVFLNGKAIFDVAKNPSKPFWVHTHKISTQVLGTIFTVTGFDENENANVQVKSGRVSVYLQKDLKKNNSKNDEIKAGLVLLPNQQALFSGSDVRLIKALVEKPEPVVDVPKISFVFDETPIEKVFSLLEKVYGVTVIYDKKNMEECFLSASLEEESLYEKIDLICKITHATYEIVDAQIVIHSRGCR